MEVSAIEADVVFQCLLAEMLKEYEFDRHVAKQMEMGQKALFKDAHSFLCEKFRVMD